MSLVSESAATVRRKGAYHHGGLRDALVDATRQLVAERGAENFTLADACRLAGVSTAAPYKHFADKDEILKEIVKQGFDQLAVRRVECVSQHPVGAIEGMIAMAQGYIEFARRQPAVFRLMFGQNPRLKTDDQVMLHGRSCFQGVVDDVAAYCLPHGLGHRSALIALELWTFAHGAASLVIDEDYEKVAPGLDVDAMVADVVPRILAAA